jgi:lysophospholipase L1-like esterase
MSTRRHKAKRHAAAAPVVDRGMPVGRKVAFSLVVVLGVLALLEGGARLLARAVPNARWQSQILLVDTLGFPALNRILVPDAELFWKVRPGVERLTLAGRMAGASGSTELRFTVSTDANGCRLLPSPPAGGRPVREIALLGDSCTFGVGVDDQETFGALLQRDVPDVRAVNLAVPGYTAYQGRLRLTRYPFRHGPAVVVICFGFNDAASWDSLSDPEHAARMAAHLRLARASRFVSLLADLLRAPEPTASEPGGPRRPRLSDEEFATEIRTIVAWCRAHGARPILMVWPQRVQLSQPALTTKQRILVRIGGEEQVAGVNLLPFFRDRGGEALFVDGIHANAAGHRVVADALAPLLR